MSNALTGTATLLRTTIKHDGRRFAPWIVLATVLSASSVLVYPWVFSTEPQRAAFAAAIAVNPALGLIFGPAHDLMTVDGFNAWRSLALGGFLAALGAIFTVTRATRAQEDSGQAELLASGVLGRESRLLAATGMGFLGSLLVGLIAGLVTVACGGDWEVSMLLGATFTATGWMFGSVAAVTAQIGSDSRAANAMAVGTLGVLFLMRGFLYSVDAPEWTRWVNPLGWMQETRPAAGDHWLPLLLAVAFAGAMLAVAFLLQARRDFGQGVLAPAPGPARGEVRSTWRLTLRLNRGLYLTWAVAFVALGVVFGYFTTSVTDILGSDTAVRQILSAGAATPEQLLNAYLVMILSMVGIVAAIPGVQTMLRVRTEEMDDRLEPIIATARSRSRYYAGNVIFSFGASGAGLLLAGTLIALLASGADIGISFGDALLQAVATVPAVWAVVAVSVAVVGARPHVALAAWVGVLVSFALTLLGPSFGLPDWALGISPFWHVPHTNAGNPDFTGILVVTAFTALFVLVGFFGFRRRDLAC